MDKMRMESVDMTAQNVEKIGALFPNCFTEVIDEEGEPKNVINFDLIRQIFSVSLSSETIEGCTVHNYNGGDPIACFDENIPDSVIKAIAKKQPLRVVFRDSSFANSPSKINVGETFKMLAPDTRVKVI